LRLSLVSVPVRAYTAAASRGTVSFHQLHAQCNSRIRYQKVCPLHGEVANDEIVKGYEYAKDQYVIVEPDELDKLRTESDRAINIESFVRPEEIDPLYLSGRAFYLMPDGPAGVKPYVLLQRAMADEGVWCVAQLVLYGQEQLAAIRPVENLLCMLGLQYASEIRLPDQYADEVGEADFSARELQLTKSLIEATTADRFDVAEHKDLYTDRVRQLIEAKVAGREIVAPPNEETPEVINLMEALTASIERSKGRGAKKTKPRAPPVPSVARRRRSPRKTG
jgi:DNA end-binding protein Ku